MRRIFLRLSFSVLLLFVVLSLSPARFVEAQTGPIPVERYYRGVTFLERGNLELATSYYRELLRNAVKVGNSPWLDSICYFSMLGECYYTQGDYGQALDCYHSALDIALAYSDWLSRVHYLTPSVSRMERPGVPWGPGKRDFPLGTLSEKAGMILGDNLTEERLKQGGAISELRQIEINPLEILRCMALSVRRRNEILGPLAPFDPRSEQLVQLFSKRTVSPNHWSIVWLDTLFGLALEGVGKTAEATDILNGSLLASGQYDHFLTGTVLLELGCLLLQSEKAEEAADYFLEASLSAYHFKNSILLEESLRYYAAARRVFALNKPDPVLETAFQWAKSQNGFPVLQLSLSEEIAENLIISRKFSAAAHGLRLVSNLMGNRGLENSRFADRARYLNALLNYANAAIPDGDADMAAVIDGMTRHSTWLFQLQQMENNLSAGGLGMSNQFNPRTASELYAWLLREPTHTDWAAFPMDSLAASVSIPPQVFERWFRVLMSRDLKEESFLVAERIRRVHFYSRQPMGERLFSLRYLLEAPEENLDGEARLNRQAILLAFPEYDASSKKAKETLTALSALPITPDKEDGQRQQKQLLADLQNESAVQESQLRYIAASRLRIPIVFPPQKTVSEIQQQLANETTLLSFIVVDQTVYGFLIAKDILDSWTIGPVEVLNGKIAEFLRLLGNVDGNRPVTIKDLTEKDWKKPGKDLMQFLLGDPASGGDRFSVAFKHLVIVPDLTLWYLPFEALCVPVGGEVTPLLTLPEVSLRYAPTASLAVSERRASQVLTETTIVSTELMSRSDPDVQKEAVNRLLATCEKAQLFEEESLNVPSQFFAPRLKQLVAIKEIAPLRDPIAWNPLITSKGDQSSIMSWTQLPWGGPQLVVLPGFRSAAENSLKSGGNGDEFFFPILAMKATGVPSILISRWRTGGRASLDLVENFMKNIKNDPPELTWKNTVASAAESLLNYKEEPRLRKPGQNEKVPNVIHPFFWSPFMLIDPGYPPTSAANVETVGNTETNKSETDQDAKNNTSDKETPDKEKSDKETTADSSEADSQATTPDEKTDETNEKEEDSGVHPVITVKGNDSADTKPDSQEKMDDKKATEDKKGDKTEPETGTQDPATKEPVAKEPASPKNPAGSGNTPITDEDLDDADADADDFYRPKR